MSLNYEISVFLASKGDIMKKTFTKLGCTLLACSLMLTSCGGKEQITTVDTVDTSNTTTNIVDTDGTTGSVSDTTKTDGTTLGTTTTSGNVISPDGKLSITNDELYDKLLGGWIGQMAGVALFAKTEFGWAGKIMTDERVNTMMNEWNNGTVSINDAFGQDDLYVEIPFIDAMKEHGAFCDVKYMAEKFRNSTFALWHANKAGRDNLLAGIEYPDSGHYIFNSHADDIDWQIECDFLGNMYPGLVNASAKRSFEIGHIMNYGDGVYGGVFVTAMHAAAFTANSVNDIIKAGISVIPDGTTFKDTMDLVMESYAAGDTWRQCWQKLEDAYGTVDKCPDMSGVAYNIDAKLNSAYILIGLLWGNGDFEQSMLISGMCGQDSDCNPSSVAGILGNFYGASKIPEKYKKGLDYTNKKFSATNYTLTEVVDINFALMKEVLLANGATENNGTWNINVDSEYTPVEYEQWGDDFDAGLLITNIGNGEVKLELNTVGNETVSSITIDMGDGNVFDANLARYVYEKTGEYTIKYTVVGSGGTVVTRERQIVLEDTVSGTPICSVTAPTGGGSKDLNTIFDRVIPYVTNTSSSVQYDTYDGGEKKDSVYAGIEFSKTYTLKRVEFTEGKHFDDGGWFAEAPVIEILKDGKWQTVKTTISTPYPTGNTKAAHGNNFDVYVFTLETPTKCDGVRIIGKPGGKSYFISIGEITPVCETESEFDNDKDAFEICSVTIPQGGGNKDITIISDGNKGSNSNTQYDTYRKNNAAETAYVGYVYKTSRKVSEIEFTEGGHFDDGGWFKNGDISIELYINGKWVEAKATVNPSYPNGDSKNTFGNGYETYTFKLDKATECNGVRVIGAAGGRSGFISVSEMAVS